ncbi:hypothetical protein TNCV_2669791 [Trichonephila clavipes]|nr:hypothetical protein TNCV_2669791 [Trichonephila clavipes]
MHGLSYVFKKFAQQITSRYNETFVIPLDKLRKALQERPRALHAEEAFNGCGRMTKQQMNAQDCDTQLGRGRTAIKKMDSKKVPWASQILRSVVG